MSPHNHSFKEEEAMRIKGDIKHEVKTVTRTEHTVIISQEALLEWIIRKEGGTAKVPPTAEATITVPRGGDWSGDSISIEDVGGIRVTWTDEVIE